VPKPLRVYGSLGEGRLKKKSNVMQPTSYFFN